MSAMLTLRIDDDLLALLDRVRGTSGRTRSDLARDALRRQLTLEAFETLRRETLRHASSEGFITDEDVFSAIS
jgi:predicted transcriptional regulator